MPAEVMERDYGDGTGSRSLGDPEPGSVSDVLVEAMRYLDEHGWCQYVAQNNEGEVCGHGSVISSVAAKIAGMPNYIMSPVPPPPPSKYWTPDALRVLGNGEPEMTLMWNKGKTHLWAAQDAAHRLLMEAAIRKGWDSEGGFGPEDKPFKDAFGVFNDAPQTTVEDVKQMMLEAIAQAESEGL